MKQFLKSPLRPIPFLRVQRHMSRDGGDTRMRDRGDPIPLEYLSVSLPPILHDIFVFKVSDDDGKGHPIVTQNLVKEAIASLHRDSESPGVDAEEEEVDATSFGQGHNEPLSHLDGAHECIDTRV